MMYLTGELAFGIPCKLETNGRWDISRKQFANATFVDSDNTLWGNYGIEEAKIIPGKEFTVFNVANHVRAYLDMLLAVDDLSKMEGIYEDWIGAVKYRLDIFECVYSRMRDHERYNDVVAFFIKEFGNAWPSYVKSIDDIKHTMQMRANEAEMVDYLRTHSGKGNEVISDLIKKHGNNLSKGPELSPEEINEINAIIDELTPSK